MNKAQLESLIYKMEKLGYPYIYSVNMFTHKELPLLNINQAKHLIYKVVTFND